jgi:hypothetical protein
VPGVGGAVPAGRMMSRPRRMRTCGRAEEHDVGFAPAHAGSRIFADASSSLASRGGSAWPCVPAHAGSRTSSWTRAARHRARPVRRTERTPIPLLQRLAGRPVADEWTSLWRGRPKAVGMAPGVGDSRFRRCQSWWTSRGRCRRPAGSLTGAAWPRPWRSVPLGAHRHRHGRGPCRPVKPASSERHRLQTDPRPVSGVGDQVWRVSCSSRLRSSRLRPVAGPWRRPSWRPSTAASPCRRDRLGRWRGRTTRSSGG